MILVERHNHFKGEESDRLTSPKIPIPWTYPMYQLPNAQDKIRLLRKLNKVEEMKQYILKEFFQEQDNL